MYADPLDEIHIWIRSHFFGKYRGTVSSNDDDTQRGRLKVKVPAVLGSLEVWAMPCVPYAGDDVGFYCLPEEDAGVWIEFEGGDPSYPIWTGCFWADGELPDEASAPTMKLLKATQAQIQIDDSSGEIVAKNQNDATLTLDSDIKSEAGGATHTVGSSGVVSEKGSGKVEVTDSSVKLNDGAFEVM
jgi:uncharacterized protein involved in type VI secretion and phage assembly